MNYTVQTEIVTLSSLKMLVRSGLVGQKLPMIGSEMLLVFNNKQLLAHVPFIRLKDNISDRPWPLIAKNLLIAPATFSLDPQLLVSALNGPGVISDKVIIHLPLICPGFTVLFKQSHPFVDMDVFDQDEFVHARGWLKKKRKAWSDVKFSFSDFQYNRDKNLVGFYLNKARGRYKLPNWLVWSRVKEFKSRRCPTHVAVVKYKDNIAAVWFVRKDAQGNVFTGHTAFDESCTKWSPGKALIYFLLCYIKDNAFTSKVYFGPLDPAESDSYKLEWCENFEHTYLYLVLPSKL